MPEISHYDVSFCANSSCQVTSQPSIIHACGEWSNIPFWHWLSPGSLKWSSW